MAEKYASPTQISRRSWEWPGTPITAAGLQSVAESGFTTTTPFSIMSCSIAPFACNQDCSSALLPSALAVHRVKSCGQQTRDFRWRAVWSTPTERSRRPGVARTLVPLNRRRSRSRRLIKPPKQSRLPIPISSATLTLLLGRTSMA